MWALASQSSARIKAMLDLASKHKDMIVKISDFDSHSKSVNTSSGFYVIGSNNLESHEAKPLVTKITNVAYDTEATCPRFAGFLNEDSGEDKELIAWIQRAFGYSLLGNTDEQCLFIAYGTGANGKSAVFEVIREILGDYPQVTGFEMFLNSYKSNVRMLEAIGELAEFGVTDGLINGEDLVEGSDAYDSSVIELRDVYASDKVRNICCLIIRMKSSLLP